MISEAFVVLVLTVLAIGFIVWLRTNSQVHPIGGQSANVGVESEEMRDRK